MAVWSEVPSSKVHRVSSGSRAHCSILIEAELMKRGLGDGGMVGAQLWALWSCWKHHLPAFVIRALL